VIPESEAVAPPPAPPTLWRRFLGWRWWVQVLLVFAASRVVTTVILLAFAAAQQQNSWTGPHPDYFSFASIWDGHWYYIVAVSGYPTTLPIGADGHVAQNAWAFLPAYPGVVRVLMGSGGSWEVVSVVVSVAFAAGAALVFSRLMTRVLPAGTALFATVLLCTAPLSPILQVAYAESMGLFFLLLALLLLLDRRYLLLIPVVAVLGFTRPGAIAFAALLLFHLIHRFATRRRDPLTGGAVLRIVVAGLASFVVGIAWPVIAGLVTGDRAAYTDTELSWRVLYLGHYDELVPFQGWIEGADWWLRWIHVPFPASLVLGCAGLVLLVAILVVLLFTPWARRLGVDLRFWLVGYGLYLLAVFFPQSSVFRVLVPLAPGLGAFAVPQNRVWRASLVVLGILGQIGWIYIAWWVDGYDWTPP
jgi:hypothetical protein